MPTEDILTKDFAGFLAKVTAPFLLVQSAFCLGLAAGALQSAAEHLQVSGGVFKQEFGGASRYVPYPAGHSAASSS